MNINMLKNQLHAAYEKDEKLTTCFKPINNEDVVINKAYLDETLVKIDGHV